MGELCTDSVTRINPVLNFINIDLATFLELWLPFDQTRTILCNCNPEELLTISQESSCPESLNVFPAQRAAALDFPSGGIVASPKITSSGASDLEGDVVIHEFSISLP